MATPKDVRETRQYEQLERLVAQLKTCNQDVDVLQKAVEIAEKVGSFEGETLLSMARGKIIEANLLIKEVHRVLAKAVAEGS
jgi:pimeloyl-CoA synthetase